MLFNSDFSAAERRDAPLLRVATLTFFAHLILSVFSAVAFGTFLLPPLPAFLMTPTNQRIMAFSFTYGGQTTVVLGAVAGFAFLAWAIGRRQASLVFVVSFVVSLGAELAGTASGLPFGPYSYTSQLGYLIASLVPFNIPTSWFYMLVAVLGICGRFLPAKDDRTSRWWWAFIAGVVLTAWDVSMDPAMVKTTHWLWHNADLTNAPTLSRILGTGYYYQMPLTNLLGWLLTGVIVARLMLAIVPPSVWGARVSPHRFPLALYATNGILPIVICYRWDMVYAGILGSIAMGIPLYLAWRAEPTTASATSHAPHGREGAHVVVAGD
jgi:uncharacterized membrane protein